MERYKITDASQYGLIEALLDEAGIDYEWDSGDRLMVDDAFSEDIEDILKSNDIDFDIIF